MDFVGDYKTKRKLAEQLRRREDDLTKESLRARVDPLVTQASGAFPGQMGVNWGDALGKVANAYFGKKAGEQAGTAEKESQAARMAGLQNLLGGGSPGETRLQAARRLMNPETLMQASELEIDPSIIKMGLPNDAVVSQASQTEAGIDSLGSLGILSPDEVNRKKAELRAQAEQTRQQGREDFLFKEQNKYHAPVQQRALTKYELMQTPEGRKIVEDTEEIENKYKPAKDDDYTKSVKQTLGKSDPKLAGALPDLESYRGKIEGYQKQKWEEGTGLRYADAFGKLFHLEGDFAPSQFISAEAQKQIQDINDFRLAALERMKGTGSVTEREQQTLKETVFGLYDSPEVRKKKLDTMHAAIELAIKKAKAAQYRIKTGDYKAAIGGDFEYSGSDDLSDLDAEMNNLMGGQ